MRATILPPPPPADFSGRSAYHAISGRWSAGEETWSAEEVWSAVWALDDGDPTAHVPTLRAGAPESSDFEGLAILDTIMAAAG
jgi:hypothetical protein